MGPNWLDDVVLLNESKEEHAPGDVSVHRSEGEALSEIEGWWVENEEGFAFSAAGERLVLAVGPTGGVFVARRETCPEGPAIVLGWLRALAEARLKARSRAAEDGRAILGRAEEEEALPDSVEGLLAYVGFEPDAPRSWIVPGSLLLLALIALLLVVIVVQLL